MTIDYRSHKPYSAPLCNTYFVFFVYRVIKNLHKPQRNRKSVTTASNNNNLLIIYNKILDKQTCFGFIKITKLKSKFTYN